MITNIGIVGIRNANRLTVDQAVMPTPTARSTLQGWFRPIVLIRIKKQTVDFQTVEVEKPLRAFGVVQPLSATALAIKPEGQRAWKWWSISATPDLELIVDEKITYRGTKLRIMRQLPFEANDVVQYEAVEDYGNE